MKRRLLVVAGSIAAALLPACGWLLFLLAVPVGRGTPQSIVIGPGASLRFVARSLKARGLIRSERAFWLAARGGWKRVRQGEYRVEPTAGTLDIAKQFTEGRVYAYGVTVPEGFTIRDIAAALSGRGIAGRDEFAAAATAGRMLKTDFPLPAGSLEGYLFPDTYRVLPGPDAAEMLVAQMLGRFDELVWRRLLRGSAPQGDLTLHEIITLASLVEGEARKDGERALIAGVLTNRLRIGMKLQCDATIQFALGDHKSRLTYADLQIASPYNTYLHAGLPPGPINNPGLACIRAALHPRQSDFLYYVARSDGSHIFSRTLVEHQAAIARVRRPSVTLRGHLRVTPKGRAGR